MFRRNVLMIAIGGVLIAATACGGGDGERTFDTGNGEVTVSEDLPDSFPDDFPVYDGADLQGSFSGEQDGIEGIVVTWTSGDDLDDVTAFYDGAFDGDPWKVALEGSAGGSTYWSVENAGSSKVGYIAVSDGGDGVTIMATVGDNPDQATDDGSSGDGDSSSDGDTSSSDDGTSDDEASSDDGSSSDDEVSADLPDEVDLPDGFPSDLVALPDGARVTTAQSYSANGAETFLVGFHTKDSADEVGDYYQGKLEGKGYTQSIKTSDGTGVYAAYAENADGTGTIVVISVNDGSIEGYREGVIQVTEG